MDDEEVKLLLINKLGFIPSDIQKLEEFKSCLLDYNKRHNFISNSTEKNIWTRHILDSAQLTKYIDNKSSNSLADLGSGAGFPGLVIAIYNKNPMFHVKLYEKSPVKREFLFKMSERLNIKFNVEENIYSAKIESNIIVSRAFKKISEIMRISREIISKPHKIIILKGKNAQEEINKVSLDSNYSYKIEKSITSLDSKIIIIDAKQNG